MGNIEGTYEKHIRVKFSAPNIGPLLETGIIILNKSSEKIDVFITISLLISEGSRRINLPNKM